MKGITAGQLIDIKFSPRKIFMPPILIGGKVGMVYSATGIGKTYFCDWLAASASAGTKFLKFESILKAKALYIDNEMLGQDLQERLIEMADAKLPLDCNDLVILSPDISMPNGEPLPDIGSVSGQAEYEPWIAQADLVIFDNLTCLLRKGPKEDDVSAWLRLAPWLTKIKAAGKSVVIVHHAGKSGAQLGTQIKEFGLDWVLELRRPSDYTADQGACFDVYYEKGRMKPEEKRAFNVQMHTVDGKIKWECSDLGEKIQDRMREMKRSKMTDKQIADEIGKNLLFVKRFFKEEKSEPDPGLDYNDKKEEMW